MWSNSQSNYHKVKNVNYLSFRFKTSKTFGQKTFGQKTFGQKTFGQLDKYFACTIGNFLIYTLLFNHYKTESIDQMSVDIFLTQKDLKHQLNVMMMTMSIKPSV